MIRKIIFLLFFIAISLCSYSLVSSKDTLKVINLNSIEITGLRPSILTPISQKTISDFDIKKEYHGQEMTYILEKTPSITTQSDGGHPNGYTYFRLRGIDQTRINVTMDGVPLNEPEDQGAYYSNYPNFAMYIKSLQIQRGVGTSSNGTSSYGGSINFETKNGLDKTALASISNGSFNTASVSLSYGTGLNNNLSFFGGTSLYTSDGYRYHSGGNGYSLFLTGGYYGSENVVKFVLLSGKSNNQMSWLAVPESEIKFDRKTNINPFGENDNFTQTISYLQFINKVSNNSTLSNTIFYTRLDGKWGMFTIPDELFLFNLKSNFFGLLTNFKYINDEIKINGGINMNGYNRTHFGVMNDIQSYTNRGYKKDFSGYVKTEYKLNNFVFFNDLQLRYVNFKYNGSVNMKPFNWFFFNPRGGVNYIFNHSNLYTSIGLSHREPTRSDLFGGNDDLVSINNFHPESVVNYEFGYNLKTTNFKLNTNLFYMDFKNEIILAGAIGTNSLPLMTSVDKSYRMGVENELNYDITKNISITNIFTYSYNRIIGNNIEYSHLYTPNLILNQSINYKINNFDIMLNGRYVSNSFINFDNTEILPNYFILSTKIEYTINNTVISFDGINLLNTKYYSGGYHGENENFYYVGTPLSFYTTLKIKL